MNLSRYFKCQFTVHTFMFFWNTGFEIHPSGTYSPSSITFIINGGLNSASIGINQVDADCILWICEVNTNQVIEAL